jgi:hypothetical protein
MRKVICFAVSVIFLSVSSVTFGADFWEKKEYKKWNKRECSKMLTDSPWARDFTQMDSQLQSSTRTSDDGQQFYVKYQAQFASALPIRQAQVRQMQLLQNYDSLESEQKKQMDQSAEAFLAKQFPDAVIVFVTYGTNSQTANMNLARYWQAQTTDLLKNKVFLRNAKGDRVDLVQFMAYQGAEQAFQFIFPRQTEDGEPLVKPDDKNLMLEFSYPPVAIPGTRRTIPDDGREGSAFLEFKPQKMVLDGNLTY